MLLCPVMAITRRAFAPVDAASLALFRIGFGLLMAWWAFDYLALGRVTSLYIAPRFHFTYYGLDGIQPWPGAGMLLEFGVLAFCALCVAAGLFYRVTSVMLAVGFTHCFLLDRTNYQNHYYLLALVSWTVALLPLHHQFSLDVLNGVTQRSALPAWMLWLVRFHIALPYVFGGVAKLDADWFAGEPMRQVLAQHQAVPILGSWLATESAVSFFKWGGLLFDLLIVPLLLWRPTRIPAYIVALGFHATNAWLFNIHVFPWFMMFASTVFFAPDWPRRLLRRPAAASSKVQPALPRGGRWIVAALAAYAVFHIAWPLRHYAYGPDAAWTERGHYFSWRMMLRGKTSGLRYYMVDKASGRWWVPDVYQFINEEQSGKFARDPEMILHFAHFLADEYRRLTGREAAVHALVLTSLNGRTPQLLVDPNVDLAGEPRGFHHRPWIVPLREKLGPEPWRFPLAEWEQRVEIPPLTFLVPQDGNTTERAAAAMQAGPPSVLAKAWLESPSSPSTVLEQKEDY